jgi:hypothetical protein
MYLIVHVTAAKITQNNKTQNKVEANQENMKSKDQCKIE